MSLLLTIVLCTIFGIFSVWIKNDAKSYLCGFIAGTIIALVNVLI